MARETLQFVHADRPPETGDVRVFDSFTRRFLGTAFTFRIIGSSHYVSAPEYDFYELSTCDPAPTVVRDGTGIPLESDRPPRRLVFETDALRCVTTVEHRPLSAFPHDRFRSGSPGFDLAYAFDGNPDAVTTIEIAEDGYETYHTYPEFDLALYTRSAFTRRRDSSPHRRSPDPVSDVPRESHPSEGNDVF
ncbi:DUF2617 family protein [Natrinema salaciae]|uniref:DUF2617 family protein n=1 Tax=Natrinema salaciae TaxID=1186196 RepID=A0A1H9JEI2_9EURY|nr:DUF2617 family protein [Natrinema salaciae]SEQ85149.1 Protein of unknown function DUF2617 [Natrinema salaciae]